MIINIDGNLSDFYERLLLPIALVQKQGQKLFTTENTEGAEFYFVNSAIGAVNNKKVFSVPSVFSVSKIFCILQSAMGRFFSVRYG